MRALLGFGLFLLPSIIWAFPFDQYPQDDLEQLVDSVDQEAISKNIQLEKRYAYLPAVRKSSVVEYTGKYRDTTDANKKFLSDLIKSFPFIPKQQTDLYTKEILVKVGNRKIWALTQGRVFGFLDKELKVGENFKIFYFWFGANQHDHIIAINEFLAPKRN